MLSTSSLSAASRNDPTAAYAQQVQADTHANGDSGNSAAASASPGRQRLAHVPHWSMRRRAEGRCRLASSSPPGVTEAFAAALKSAKFPLIPKDVIKQRGENFLDVKTHIGID
jgi:hypothetical protein